jgi:hypothetical protein
MSASPAVPSHSGRRAERRIRRDRNWPSPVGPDAINQLNQKERTAASGRPAVPMLRQLAEVGEKLMVGRYGGAAAQPDRGLVTCPTPRLRRPGA